MESATDVRAPFSNACYGSTSVLAWCGNSPSPGWPTLWLRPLRALPFASGSSGLGAALTATLSGGNLPET